MTLSRQALAVLRARSVLGGSTVEQLAAYLHRKPASVAASCRAMAAKKRRPRLVERIDPDPSMPHALLRYRISDAGRQALADHDAREVGSRISQARVDHEARQTRGVRS